MGVHILSARVVKSNREGEHKASVRRAAELLMSPAPPWLIEVLSDFSFNVVSQHSIDQISPEKKKMFDDVSGAQVMAIGLIKFLQSPCGPGYLASHSVETTEEFQRELVEPLQNFLRGTIPAFASLVDKQGNVRSGRGRASLPGTMSAKYVCAAIVSEAAAFVQEKHFPSPRKTDLFKAATELWTSWLPLEGWGNSRGPSWKRYFEASNDDRLASLRSEVNRHLTIGLAIADRRTK